MVVCPHQRYTVEWAEHFPIKGEIDISGPVLKGFIFYYIYAWTMKKPQPRLVFNLVSNDHYRYKSNNESSQC